MKNFSELLDTDVKITVSVSVAPITDNGDPRAWIRINDRTLYHNRLAFPILAQIDVDLLDPIEIEIGMSDKIYDQNLETAVVIDSVCIDGFEIIPNFTHLAQYQNERNIDQPTSYLGFNGSWKLTIPEPFYRWQHRVSGQGWLLEPVLPKNNTI